MYAVETVQSAIYKLSILSSFLFLYAFLLNNKKCKFTFHRSEQVPSLVCHTNCVYVVCVGLL